MSEEEAKEYWQQRCARAEMVLTTVTALLKEERTILANQHIEAYFESLMAGPK